MKSLKARFKKADVSAVPGDTGTCPGMSSQGREDVGISPRVSPGSQGCGDLPWDMRWLLTVGAAAPRRSALPPWLVGPSSRCTQGGSRGHRWEGAQQRDKGSSRERETGPGSQVPSLSPSWGQLPASQLPQLAEPSGQCSSIIQHQPGTGPRAPATLHTGQGVTALSPVPVAAPGDIRAGDTWLGTRGHRLKPPMWILHCPAWGALCLSFPTLPWSLP